ncbi:metallophosphoesterase family protein [Mucilaginibacter jinjuensis]|uniref:Metallophosphoesterase n=1 Tax=Mucilaginibacter jinjuensis TaxID=1176721 RepID=A0ABY7T514_9SPHI|nr:metallophosphoesterase [Mucilaginibacter jinjuensis]WCT11555.1 metallophosphoesterase [Mucilaginibacter jinjuensis]
MAVNTLKIAVISDLHCHPLEKDFNKNNTLLFSDGLRLPTTEHPVENLLEIIEKEKIKVDLVLSPGDFTHQSNRQGLFSGWSYVNEIARALKADDVIATIGNHDIDSRHTYSNYSFEIPKKVSQSFPLHKDKLKSFWDTGFTFIDESEYLILVVNSTHFHTHYNKDNPVENPAVKGKMDLSQIEQIDKYLSENSVDTKIKIVLVHHHPIQHSRLKLGEEDVIENGDSFMNVLGKHRFDLVVHGHKHDPWLRYIPSENGFAMPVLSSGSFSATNQTLWINKFNYFHVIEIVKTDNHPANGTIETYTFKKLIGWAKGRDDGFYPYSGFGYKESLTSIVEELKKLVTENTVMVKWEVIIAQIPQIKFLTPDKLDELEELLSKENILTTGKIGIKPKHFYYEGA